MVALTILELLQGIGIFAVAYVIGFVVAVLVAKVFS